MKMREGNRVRMFVSGGFALLASLAAATDVVIYGGTPAGLTAAVQVRRMGLSCVVVEPTGRIGGLTTGGLGCTDIGNKDAFGGLARRFYREIASHYAKPGSWTRQKPGSYVCHGQSMTEEGEETMWTFEPSVALAILESWEKAEGLEILRHERLDRSPGKVKVEGEGGQRRIVSVATESGRVLKGRFFIDATYEGDLLAAAGVSYTVGREPNARYGETVNGIQRGQAVFHQFADGVSAYVREGDPSSGLLPGIERDVADPDGTGDRRVQAYCFRMCLTDDPENRIPFAKPDGYRESDYELLFRNYAALVRSGQVSPSQLLPWINTPMPNRKTDTNNRRGFSTDLVGGNWGYPEASYAERAEIEKRHLLHQQGLMWTLANHPRVPELVRNEVSRWGTCKDEFVGERGNGWQNQLYVREGRRMVGDYVMTEGNCRGTRVASRPVALAAYQMDSHHVRRYADENGFVRNEGDVEIRRDADGRKFRPYPIDYGALVPKRGECANLLVPVCLSASHIAFGSIRMEPVFFALGQAAGTAAALCAERDCAVQDLPYAVLRKRLLADGQRLSRPGKLVAHPVTQAWPAPSFRGKPFWPLFAKLSHNPETGGTDSSAGGLDDLPLTQEYASCLNTHNYRAGVAKYRKTRQKDPKSGKTLYAEPVPEGERLLGSYTLRQLFGPAFGEYLYSGDWTTRRLWNPQKGSPFLLAIRESRPVFYLDGEDRGDKADFSAWAAAHPGFLGFYTLGEIDSDCGNYIKSMTYSAQHAKVEGGIRRDLESRFPLPKDRRYGFIDLMRRCWETEKRFHFGCDRFWPLYCNNHTLAHINASFGAVGLQNEISSSQGSPWTWSGAYTRGASRQWGIPFSWYCATYYRGFRRNQAPGTPPVTGDNKWPRNGIHTKKRQAYCGASLSLTARQKYYGWLIGAAMIQDEPWSMLCSSATNGIPCPSPYAEVFNDVLVRSRKIDRGAPLTPIALLTPITECVSRGGYVAAAKGPDGLDRDALNLPAYFFTLQPVHESNGKYPMLLDRRRQGDEGCLFNSKFGEIWDVLVADSGQPAERFGSALGHYPAAFLIGTYRAKELDVAALEAYVRGGGTLFLSADYVEEGLVPVALAGVAFGDGRVTSGATLVDEKGTAVERLSAAYLLHAGEAAEGTRVLLKDENGVAVAYVRQLGKGRVVTTACHRSMPEAFHRPTKGVDDADYLELRRSIISDEAELGLIRYLLDRVQRETIPVQVCGDIQWGVNKTASGYLVWLINNKGIVKYFGEPADVDLSKTATVTVRLGRLAGFVPFDADSGERLPVTDGAFQVSVPPGDVRFVRIGLQEGK